MALRYPDRLESNNPAAYGIVKAIEIAGHRTVQTLSDLYTIADAILSDSGNNANSDAIGQSWYVVGEHKEYQLIDWNNRKQASGWQATTSQLQENITEVQNQLTSHINNKENPHTVTKAQIGLGNVDNTADLDKPISTATQTALDGKVDKEANKSLVSNDLITKLEGLDSQETLDAAIADKIPLSQKGVANGVATLSENGKIPAQQLPTYVDDVLEGTLVSPTEFTLNEGQQGEVKQSGVVYVDTTTNKSYRWSGSQYVMTGSDLALGETSSTAYAGDKGKQVTDRVAEVYSANSVINGLSDVTFDSDDTEAQTLSADNALKTWDGSGTSHDMKIPYATTSKAGVMSAADKTKVNGALQTANAGVGVLAAYAIAAEKVAISPTDTINQAIGKLEKALNNLAGDGEGSVAEQIQAAITALIGGASEGYQTLKELEDAIKNNDSELTALEARVATNEGKLTVIQGEETVDGSIKKALKDAKGYTDSKLTWITLD